MNCKSFLLSIFCIFWFCSLDAQIDSLSQEEESLLTHKERHLIKISTDTSTIDSLMGDVIFYQDSTIMYCDTAIIFNETQVLAYGNVAIVQNDTLEIYSDTLRYDATTKKAILIDKVVLRNEEETLLTEKLEYDLNTKWAYFNNGASIIKGNLTLNSKQGSYNTRRKQAFFSEEVVVQDSSFTLWTDSLDYNLRDDVASFFGPTRVKQNEADLYSEGGTYHVADKSAMLEGNAQYVKDTLQASADVIFYDGYSKDVILQDNASFKQGKSEGQSIQIVYNEITELSILTGDATFLSDGKEVNADVIEHDGSNDTFKTRGRTYMQDEDQFLESDEFYNLPKVEQKVMAGNVQWTDTLNSISMKSDTMLINDKDNTILAYNASTRPILYIDTDGDTLWLSAERLGSQESIDSLGEEMRRFHARSSVRLFKKDFQSHSDSFSYNTIDSIFRFYNNPIIWVDSTQFNADTINIFMENNSPKLMHLIGNAMIISQSYPNVFDQIKGKEVTVWMDNNAIDSMLVEGNAESIYFMKDEEESFIGADQTQCNSITFIFEASQLIEIHSISNPSSTFLPMQQVNLQEMVLAGFSWQIEKRPLSVKDLIEYDP